MSSKSFTANKAPSSHPTAKSHDASRPSSPASLPLLVYVHIPKTGGTSVGTYLYQCSPFGMAEISGAAIEAPDFCEKVIDLDWITGHIQRSTFALGLIWLPRKVLYFSCVREPTAQLISHLNYSFERLGRPRYLETHSEEEQRRDARVVATDFACPSAIVDMLEAEAHAFLNVQSRSLFGDDAIDVPVRDLEYRLRSYAYVGTEHTMPDLFSAFGFADQPHRSADIRENVSTRHFDQSVFEAPLLREFLSDRNGRDVMVYSLVKDRKWAVSAPPRPAFLAVEPFTDETFDEGEYLSSNPDVAAAVSAGSYVSGRSHYLAAGRGERRPRRVWRYPLAGSDVS